MRYRDLHLRIPQPDLRLNRPRLSRWLPTRSNVFFTLLIVGLLVIAQTVGALPSFNSQSAIPNSQSTIACAAPAQPSFSRASIANIKPGPSRRT